MVREVCPQCGEENNSDAEFCGTCRGYLGWDRRPGVNPTPTTQPAAHGGAIDVDRWIPASRVTPPAPPAPPVFPGRPGRPRSLPWEDSPGRRPTPPRPHRAEPGDGRRLPLPPPRPPGPGIRTADQMCPQCGTRNDPQLRFCRKCGHTLVAADLAAAPAVPPPSPPRLSWWRRRVPGPANPAGKAALRTYRKTLPWRYRARRTLLVLLTVALLAAGSVALNHNPAGWLKDRWNDLRNTLVPVAEVQAVAAPAGSALPDYPAALAVDNIAATAWATPWTTPSITHDICPSLASAPIKSSAGSLRLILQTPVTVRAIAIAAGLAATDPLRPHEWQPATLQLAFSNGTCQRITLSTTTPDLQQLALTPPTTTTEIRITILTAAPPTANPATNVVAISDIRLYQRP